MSLRAFKYLSPFLLYVGALQAFFADGWVIWLPLGYSFVLIPLLELFIRPNESNLSHAEEEMVRKDKVYDVMLWLIVPFQYVALACYFYSITFVDQSGVDLAGKTAVMGLLCGTFGINVGH